MSLFEDEKYSYRDTFFVLFEKSNRPSPNRLKDALMQLGNRYQITNAINDDSGTDSVTVVSPYDFSAMDVVYVEGDEVQTQVKELMEEFRTKTLFGDEAQKLKQLKSCNARFDIYHFEQAGDPNSDEDHLDPGALLLVIDCLTNICKGTGVDPQSMSLI